MSNKERKHVANCAYHIKRDATGAVKAAMLRGYPYMPYLCLSTKDHFHVGHNRDYASQWNRLARLGYSNELVEKLEARRARRK
jgi:hypothetical protein